METVKLRRDFMRLRNGRWQRTPRVDIQACVRQSSSLFEQKPLRFGLIVSKKVGNAVTRNRVKRRLRAAIKYLHPALVKAMQRQRLHAIDIGLVARPVIIDTPFAAIVEDIDKGAPYLFRGLENGKFQQRKTSSMGNARRGARGVKARRYHSLPTRTFF